MAFVMSTQVPSIICAKCTRRCSDILWKLFNLCRLMLIIKFLKHTESIKIWTIFNTIELYIREISLIKSCILQEFQVLHWNLRNSIRQLKFGNFTTISKRNCPHISTSKISFTKTRTLRKINCAWKTCKVTSIHKHKGRTLTDVDRGKVTCYIFCIFITKFKLLQSLRCCRYRCVCCIYCKST